MKVKEIRELTTEQIVAKVKQAKEELFNLNITEYVRKNPRNRSLSERKDAY